MNLRSIFCWFHLFLTRDTIIKENLDRKRDREHIEKKLGFFFVNRNVPSAKTPNDETMAESSELSQAKISCVHRDPHTHARERERESRIITEVENIIFPKKKKMGTNQELKKSTKKKGAKINLKPLLIGWFWIVSLLQLAPISFCFARWWRDLCVKFLTLNEKCCLCTLNSYIFLF